MTLLLRQRHTAGFTIWDTGYLSILGVEEGGALSSTGAIAALAQRAIVAVGFGRSGVFAGGAQMCSTRRSDDAIYAQKGMFFSAVEGGGGV